jgi:hypothetical protein
MKKLENQQIKPYFKLLTTAPSQLELGTGGALRKHKIAPPGENNDGMEPI